MLLGSLKDDLKRTSAIIVASSVGSPGMEHSRKRREVSTKLWRAFVAYNKSFDEIDSFTRNTRSSNGSAGSQSAVAGVSPSLTHKIQNPQSTLVVPKSLTPQSTPNSAQKKAVPQSTPTVQSVRVTPPVKTTAASSNLEGQSSSASRRRPRPVNSNIVIELSDSDEGDKNVDKSPVRKHLKVEVDSSSVPHSDSPETSSNIKTATVSKDNGKKEQQLESEVSELSEDGKLFMTCEKQQIKDAVVNASLDAVTETLDEENEIPSKIVRETESQNPNTKFETDSATVQINSQRADELRNGVSELNVNAKVTSSSEQTNNSCTNVELDAVSETAEKNITSTNNEPKPSSTTKTELFSSLRFEPLFEIQPLNGSKS